MQQSAEKDFIHLAELCETLESRLQQFCSDREHVDSEIDQIAATLSSAREKLINLDSLTGDENDLVRRLNGVKVSLSNIVKLRASSYISFVYC